MRMNKIAAESDQKEVRSPAIADDRALLKHLRLTDSDAAMFLGCSRQTLINHLGPKKNPPHPPPTTYFALTDIVILVSAARQLGKEIDPNAIQQYVDSTRRPRETDPQDTYLMLIGLLGGSSEKIELKGATTVVFVMPAFAEFRAHHSAVVDNLKDMVEDKIPRLAGPPCVYLLAPTNYQARAVGSRLGIDEKHCFGSEVIEHYLPSILVYRGESEPSPYVLTESGAFVAAPRFMNHMVAECVRSLLPSDVGQKLLPSKPVRKASGGD